MLEAVLRARSIFLVPPVHLVAHGEEPRTGGVHDVEGGADVPPPPLGVAEGGLLQTRRDLEGQPGVDEAHVDQGRQPAPPGHPLNEGFTPRAAELPRELVVGRRPPPDGDDLTCFGDGRVGLLESLPLIWHWQHAHVKAPSRNLGVLQRGHALSLDDLGLLRRSLRGRWVLV